MVGTIPSSQLARCCTNMGPRARPQFERGPQGDHTRERPPAMRRPTRLLLGAGLVLELTIGLFPPMHVTIPNGAYPIHASRHFFVFRHLYGGWTIDPGRLLAYVLIIAVATALPWQSKSG